MIKVGVIGFGFAGQAFHAPVVHAVDGLELACIVERSGNSAQQRFPNARVVCTVEEMLKDDGIRLCVVATPQTSHFELARKCLLAGRDVVVDKPFTTNLKDAEELVRLAQANGRMITVYQNRRYDGDFLTVQKIISSGVLGRIITFETHFDRFRPKIKPNDWHEVPSPGMGILYDLGPHLADAAYALFGAPQTVTAQIRMQREGSQVNDSFDIQLEYPGANVSLRVSYFACVPRPRYLLYGTLGSFVKYGLDPQEEILKKRETILFGEKWGEDAGEDWGTLRLADGNSFKEEKVKTERGDYRKYYENVRDAVLNGTAPTITPQSAVDVMRILELAESSSRSKRTVLWTDRTGSP